MTALADVVVSGVGVDGVEWLRLDLLLRLVLAAVLGGTVGLEREFSGKPAGFRTNLLICVGAALLTELSILVSQAADPRETNADPGRIAAQIVSGIGFLGAGTIIQARGSVMGLTTAATLWVVAAIGMTVGAHAYVEAVGATILVIVALVVLGRVETALIRRRTERTVQVTLDPEPSLVKAVRQEFDAAGLDARTVEVARVDGTIVATYMVSGRLVRTEAALGSLIDKPFVHRVRTI